MEVLLEAQTIYFVRFDEEEAALRAPEIMIFS
jgi:hypothetical protein